MVFTFHFARPTPALAPLFKAKHGTPLPLRRPCRTPLLVAMAAFPTPAERNRLLARRLKEAFSEAGGSCSYDDIKRRAADFRAGRCSAQDLCASFFGSLGCTPDSQHLYCEMAELLPTTQQYAELIAAMHDYIDLADSMNNADLGSGVHGDSSKAYGAAGREAPLGNPLSAPAAQQPPGRQQRQGSQAQDSGWPALGASVQAHPGPPSAAAQQSGGGQKQQQQQRQRQQRQRQQRQQQQQQQQQQQAWAMGSAGSSSWEQQLVEGEAAHSNSLSARPAKRLPAAKRARSGRGTSEAVSDSAAQGTAAAGGTVPAGRGGVLMWLRQDLRLHDHPALCAAAAAAKAAGGRLTLVYIHSPLEDGDEPATGTSWRPGGASMLWAEQALRCLDADLQRRYGRGAGIVYRRGPYAAALLEVAAAAGAGRLYYSRRYEPAMQATDAAVQRELEAAGLRVQSFGGFLLREPADVRVDLSNWKGHFGTLMPFYRACEAMGPIPAPLQPPATLPVTDDSPASRCGGLALEELGMCVMPRRRDGSVIDWGAPIRQAWDFSEAAALSLLDGFIAAALPRYEADRGFADGRCVSHLSPYLHWGQLSPRLMMQRLAAAGGKQVSKTFWRRLVWRDLAYWQLHHWPDMAAQPIRTHYAAQEWAHDPAALQAWQRGTTGWPLVDAAMRELWATGWVQQNARMAAACLLTEYLNMSWVEGASWFHDTLVDADLAINSMMWANAGKAGLDQWNFTVLPTSKAQDPTGAYIRRWVPELAQLPNKYIHEPWRAPREVLEAAGVVLGATYPHRLTDCDLQELRSANTAAIRAARAAGGSSCRDSQGYDLITIPQGSTTGHDGRRWRVFTKPEYRGEGGEAEQSGSSAGASGAARRRGASQGRSAGVRGQAAAAAGAGGAKKSAGQRTLDEYVSRAS